MAFFQHLQLKYKFWAVNSVTFVSTMLLVLVALWVEQDRIHELRQELAREILAQPQTDTQLTGLRWLPAGNTAATATGTATWLPPEQLSISQTTDAMHGAWLINQGGEARLLGVERQGYIALLLDRAPLYAIVVLALMLGVLMVSQLLISFITRNLLALRDVMLTVQETGDLTLRAPVVSRDEVGAMAQTFNAMQSAQQEVVGTVRQAASQLEQGTDEMARLMSSVKDGMVTQQGETDMVAAAVNEMSATVQDIAGNSAVTRDQSTQADAMAREGRDQVLRVSQTITGLATSIERCTQHMQKLEGHSQEISGVVRVIRDIAEQTNLLALNAAIEAARAGDSGRGFAVVADEVRNLAGRTSSATEEVAQIVNDIRQQSGAVVEHMQRQAEQLTQAAEQVERTGEQLQGIATLAEDVAAQVGQIDSGTRHNHERLAELSVAVGQLRSDVSDSEVQTRQLSSSSDRLVELAESVSEQLAGVKLDDYHQRVYDLARTAAQQISEQFECDVENGRISLGDLFDRNYQPIPNTFPPKFKTRFDDYADHVLPGIQEPLLQQHEGLVFAIATTAEGYVPTHNRAFNHPPTGDRTVDTARSRGKRLFNDRTGIRCGSHQQPLLLQTYTRDTGELMHDLSVPITVKGRHWGGIRLGYKPEK